MHMKKPKYDIFISYRRTAYDTANLIAVKLRHAGYKVFFDVDTLTAGKFNEQLLEVIKGCKDFILVLPENALDRCGDPEDWVRRETMCALENHKNILPVMLDGFSWPKDMPEGLEELSSYQAITAVGHEYFDMAIERMQGYLKSKTKKPLRRWLEIGGIALGIICLLLGIGFGIMYHISETTCKSIGTRLTGSIDVMENTGEDCNLLKEHLSALYKCIDNDSDSLAFKEAEKKLTMAVDKVTKNLATYRKMSPPPEFTFNSIENYLLSYYKTEAEELNAFSTLYDSMLGDMESLNASVVEMINGGVYSQEERDGLSLKFSGYSHYLNALYYGYLGSMSLLPKSARKLHFQMAQGWICFPNGTPLDLTQEEYVQFQTKEVSLYEEEMEQVLGTNRKLIK